MDSGGRLGATRMMELKKRGDHAVVTKLRLHKGCHRHGLSLNDSARRSVRHQGQDVMLTGPSSRSAPAQRRSRLNFRAAAPVSLGVLGSPARPERRRFDALGAWISPPTVM